MLDNRHIKEIRGSINNGIMSYDTKESSGDSLQITFTNPKVINFIQHLPKGVNIESLISTIISQISSYAGEMCDHAKVDTDETDESGNAQEEGTLTIHNLQMITHNLQRVIEDSSNCITSENNAAIGRLKIEISNELRDLYVKNNENSSRKGAQSEQRVMSILIKNYPSVDILDTSKILHSCDISMGFEDNLNILIENKDYSSKNIPRKEVTKFIGDLQFQNASGVLFSQSSGIANKNNFQLDIVTDTIVALYVSNTNHEPNIIIAAIDMVKNVTLMMKTYKHDVTGNVRKISDAQLKSMSNEINLYNDKISQVKQLVTKFEKDMMATIGSIQFVVTTEVVNGAADFVNSNTVIQEIVHCKYCNKDFKSKGAFTRHLNKEHPNDNQTKTTGDKTHVNTQ